jgi:ribosomal-protein-serine acetyltransferase
LAGACRIPRAAAEYVMITLRLDHEIGIRTLHPDDAVELFELLERNRGRLRPWIHPSALPETANATRKYTIECFLDSLDPLDAIDTPYIDEVRPYYPPMDPSMEMGIRYRDALAGVVGISILGESDRAAEIGYWIGEEFEGKGIVTRCVSALMTYAFDQMEVDRLVIGCAAANLRSRAVAERLGYRLCATMPNGEVIAEFVYDRVLYEMHSGDWRKRLQPSERG